MNLIRMKNRIVKWFQNERRKTAAMTPRAKAAYVWEYYKVPIVAFVSLVLVSIYLASHFVTAVRDHWVYIMFADTRAEAGNGSELWKGYVELTGFDLSEKAVDFNSEAWFDYAKDEGRGNRYFALFCGLTDEGVLDAVTMEADSLEGVGQSGRLMDLRDERCRKIYERYKDRLIYSVPYNTEYSTDPVPIGIDISDSALVTKYHLYEESCAIGIGAQSTHIEAVEQFLEYVMCTTGA